MDFGFACNSTNNRTTMSVLTYFIVGSLVSFIMETINRLSEEPNKFGMAERLLIILLWPLMSILFIYYFIKSML